MSDKIERRGRPRKKVGKKDVTVRTRIDEEMLSDFNEILFDRDIETTSDGLREAIKLYINCYQGRKKY